MIYIAGILKVTCTKNTKTYSCIGMLNIASFDIQRWRYLHITLDHFFLLYIMQWPIGRIIIFMEYSWQQKNFHQSLWTLKFQRTKETEWFERPGQLPDWHCGADRADPTDNRADPSGRYYRYCSANPDYNPKYLVTLVCQSWFPGVWGERFCFFWGPQRGLEGEKKRVLGFPKVSRRKREKKNRDI